MPVGRSIRPWRTLGRPRVFFAAPGRHDDSAADLRGGSGGDSWAMPPTDKTTLSTRRWLRLARLSHAM